MYQRTVGAAARGPGAAGAAARAAGPVAGARASRARPPTRASTGPGRDPRRPRHPNHPTDTSNYFISYLLYLTFLFQLLCRNVSTISSVHLLTNDSCVLHMTHVTDMFCTCIVMQLHRVKFFYMELFVGRQIT